jgi:hypothetical protein
MSRDLLKQSAQIVTAKIGSRTKVNDEVADTPIAAAYVSTFAL